MLTDVGSKVFVAQERGYELFKLDSAGKAVGDPERLLPGEEIEAAGWHILDPGKPDGLNYGPVKYADIRVDKSREAGALFAAERDSGKTTLFFVWLNRPIVSAIRSGRPSQAMHCGGSGFLDSRIS
jgi:hypothetical protein